MSQSSTSRDFFVRLPSGVRSDAPIHDPILAAGEKTHPTAVQAAKSAGLTDEQIKTLYGGRK